MKRFKIIENKVSQNLIDTIDYLNKQVSHIEFTALKARKSGQIPLTLGGKIQSLVRSFEQLKQKRKEIQEVLEKVFAEAKLDENLDGFEGQKTEDALAYYDFLGS